MNWRTASALLPLALAACIGPRPAAPTAAAVVPPDGWRAALRATTELEREWWRAFGDPVLADLVERSLRRNTDIGQAAARVEEARALARLARAERAPEVGFDALAQGSRSSVGGKPTESLIARAGLTPSWDVDLFGRLRFASRAARAQLLASAAARDAVALSVASTTASSYINLLGLDAQLVIARETLVLRTESLRVATRRYTRGYTSQLEYLQAKSAYESVEALIPDLQRSIGLQENALNVLLGDNPEPITRGARLVALRVPGIPAGLPSMLLRRRPDIVGAEQTLVAADRGLDSSRAAMLPQLSLTGSASVTYLLSGPSPVSLVTAAANLFGPLFDAGRRRAVADSDAARRDQAAFAYRGTVLAAFSDVENALTSIRGYAARREVNERSVVTAAQGLKISRERYRAGYSTFLAELDAQRVLLVAQQSLVQAQTDRLRSHVDLYEALGGGWRPEPIDLGHPSPR